MQQLAAMIKERLDELSVEFARRLGAVPGYTDMSLQVRVGLARATLPLIAAGLEADDSTLIVQFASERAQALARQGVSLESVFEGLKTLGDFLQSLHPTPAAATTIWRTLVQAQGEMMRVMSRHVQETEAHLVHLHSQFSLLLTELMAPAPLDDKLKQVTDWIVEHLGADFCRIWVIQAGDRCEE